MAFGFAIAALPIGLLAIIVLSTREPQRPRPAVGSTVGSPIVGETTVAQSPLAPTATPTSPAKTDDPTPGPLPADERPVIIASVRTEPELKAPPAMPKTPPAAEPKPESQVAARPSIPRAPAASPAAPAPAAAPPAGREDDAAVGFQVARRNHAGVKECWANSSKSTNVVTVAATVDASGSVTAASAKATDQGLAQCVEGKVRTWTFPAGAAGRSFNFPIRIGRN